MQYLKPENIRKMRIIIQFVTLAVFLLLFFFSGAGVKFFFYSDPFVVISNLLAGHILIPLFVITAVLLLLTIFWGRFYCGWICPMGTINHIFSWLFHKNNSKREMISPELLRVKYYLLPALLVCSFAGFLIGSWIDPYSLLTRILALFLPSINYLYTLALPEPAGKNILNNQAVSVSSEQVVIGLIILSALIFSNLYIRRFFCNVLCPAGAVYAIVSKFGFLKIQTGKSCHSCSVCAQDCTYHGNPQHFENTECTVCYNCIADCKSGSLNTHFSPLSKKEITSVDLGKRKMMGSLLGGIIITAVGGSTVESKAGQRHKYLRPPGAIKEEEFINKCLRCGQCVKSCKSGFIQSATLEAGFEGIWTPILNADAGYCLYECNACTKVCPADAIKPLTLEEKKKFKMGTAVIDTDYCYTYADGFACSVCYDKCPLPEKAIRFREIEIWDYRGKLNKIKQIFINPDVCTGCGICQNACPRKDNPGIFITSADEIREAATGFI